MGQYKETANPLIIDDGYFFHASKPAELVVEITFLCANAQAKHAQHVGGSGRLLCLISIRFEKKEE